MVTNKPELFPTKYKCESYSVLPLLNYSIASIEPLMRLFVSMFLPLSCSGRTYTLSAHIGKVVASHAAVARSVPPGVALIYTMSCFSKSRCNFSAFRASVLLRLLLDLDTYGGVCFLYYWRRLRILLLQNYPTNRIWSYKYKIYMGTPWQTVWVPHVNNI